MTNDELAVLILPWAKEHHLSKYIETVKVGGRPDAFRKYMLRLVEIRCTEEPDWRGMVPVSVLDETALVLKLRNRNTGEEFESKGQRAPGGPHYHRIGELALPKQEYELLQDAKAKLNLEYVDA